MWIFFLTYIWIETYLCVHWKCICVSYTFVSPYLCIYSFMCAFIHYETVLAPCWIFSISCVRCTRVIIMQGLDPSGDLGCSIRCTLSIMTGLVKLLSPNSLGIRLKKLSRSSLSPHLLGRQQFLHCCAWISLQDPKAWPAAFYSLAAVQWLKFPLRGYIARGLQPDFQW